MSPSASACSACDRTDGRGPRRRGPRGRGRSVGFAVLAVAGAFAAVGAWGAGRVAAAGAAAIAGAAVGPSGAGPGAQEVARLTAREIAVPPGTSDEAVLGRPAALAFDGDRLFVADAQDSAIKIFDGDGRFLRSFGRKGRGPGELSFPSGVDAAAGLVYVADKLNRRVQIFDGEGAARGGFPVEAAPDKVYALGPDALLVTFNPAGRQPDEARLRIYGAGGAPRWRGLPAEVSADPVYDSFRNMILVCPGEGGDFVVVRRSGERRLTRFDGRGAVVAETAVDERHAFVAMDMPFKGPVKRLLGFCWAAAADRGLLYLAAPEPVDGRDLGPGRRLSVVDGTGRLRATVDLPRPVHRFVVRGGRVFAVDDDGNLCLFEVSR